MKQVNKVSGPVGWALVGMVIGVGLAWLVGSWSSGPPQEFASARQATPSPESRTTAGSDPRIRLSAGDSTPARREIVNPDTELSLNSVPIAQGPESSSGRLIDAFAQLEGALFPGQLSSSDESALMDKYSGLSLEQLRVACEALQGRCVSETKRITDEMLKSGAYETQVVPKGETARGFGATGSRPMVSLGFSIEHGEFSDVVKSAVIDPVKHPEFALLEHELWWLKSYINQLTPN